MNISAYVPFYNNKATLTQSLSSLREQQPALAEIFAVDDGSTDGGAEIAETLGIRVVRNASNLGRGAVRARAMLEAKHDLVLCCDATNILPPDFAANARRWFNESQVAGVYGRIDQRAGGSAVVRWRGRHLFRIAPKGAPLGPVNRRGCLATYGALVRRSSVLAVGNYDARLRHTEDADLGQRLLAAGFDVVMDPSLTAISIAQNSLSQVLERYWRWNAGKEEKVSLSSYLRGILFSVRSMAVLDFRERDLRSAAISLYAPHFQFWRTVLRRNREAPMLTNRPKS